MKKPIFVSIPRFALVLSNIILALASYSVSAQTAQTPGQNPSPAPAPAPSRVYMSQTYVDTTVMRAIYVINEASFSSVNPNKQEHAVTQAKAILSNLKERAKGDPNYNYVLMKVSEVEMQIALEEEEMRKLAEEKRVLTTNQLVIQYNAEVGKMRPDFATLRAVFRRMSEVDTRQANNLASSYNKRYRGISREATSALEKALLANDYDLAKKELEYCEKNQLYLVIDKNYLKEQRARFERIQGASGDLPKIVSMLDVGEKAYNEFRLSESRTSLMMANNRLNDIRAHIAAKDGNAASARAARLIRALDTREDSLVNIVMGVLDKQGGDAAYEYFQEVLQKRMNLSPERASIIDQAIMKIMPEKAIVLESKVKMVEVKDDESNASGATMDQMRIRAQVRADSLKKVKERAREITVNIYTLLENKRVKDATRLFSREKSFLSSALHRSDFSPLEQSVHQGARVAAGSVEKDKKKVKAEDTATKIYALVEKNEIKDAYNRFNKYRKPLAKYLDRESFKMLELTVTQSYNYSRSVAKK